MSETANIRRTIIRYGTGKDTVEAAFRLPDGWLCCSAWISGSGSVGIQGRNNSMSSEQASFVIVALRMAVEWLEEEAKQRARAKESA